MEMGTTKIIRQYCKGSFDNSQLLARKTSTNRWNVYEKSRRSTTKAKSVWDETEMRTLKMGRDVFVNCLAKHILIFQSQLPLIKKCIAIGSNDNDIILDMFSGSATTAHAVLELNAGREPIDVLY